MSPQTHPDPPFLVQEGSTASILGSSGANFASLVRISSPDEKAGKQYDEDCKNW